MTVIAHSETFPASDQVRTELLLARTAACVLREEVAYLAVPWAGIVNRQCEPVSDTLVCEYAQRIDGYEQVVTTCQHIKFRKLLKVMKQCGVTDVLTPHCTLEARKQALSEYAINLCAIPHAPAVTEYTQRPRRFLFSFMGYANHPLRQLLVSLATPTTPIFLKNRWQLSEGIPAENKRIYANLLSESTFALCPRGTGPGSLRVSEAILAGAIPVILSDGFCLPRHWEHACLMVHEKYWQEIPERLSAFDPVEVQRLRRAGTEVAETCLRPGAFAECCMNSLF